MNQDQVKDALRALDRTVPDFLVLYSGKRLKNQDAIFLPERREIILHNRNFSNDVELMTAAITAFTHLVRLYEGHTWRRRTSEFLAHRDHLVWLHQNSKELATEN